MRLLPLTRRGTLSLAAALALPRGSQAQPGPGRFTTLAYHEVGADGGGRHYSISESTMVQHLAFLRQDGWHFVSLDDVLAARDGRRPLPDKSVLLTFDDGYDDYHTRVFPILRAFRAPGVFALVTSWMETPPGGHFDYGGTAKPRSALMSWAQAREMQASGLCEFASHSHDLHRAVRGNPQGNTQPAAVTRIWDGGYETDAAWTRRIEADLRRSAEIMARHLGRRPRCIVWPYGRHNEAAIGIARRLGMPVEELVGAPQHGPAAVILRFLLELGRHVGNHTLNFGIAGCMSVLHRRIDRHGIAQRHVAEGAANQQECAQRDRQGAAERCRRGLFALFQRRRLAGRVFKHAALKFGLGLFVI